MKYFIETYGCQMNVHDSERIAGLLESSGYDCADSDADADVVVINTCSVREKAEDKLYNRLGALKGTQRVTGHAPLVVVAGCVAQQEGARLAERSDLIDVVVGTQRLRMLPMLVEQARGADTAAPLIDISTPYRGSVLRTRPDATRRPGEGLCDDHRGLQRLLQLLCRAVHPRPRAHARQSRGPG